MISLIVAKNKKSVMGSQGEFPWHCLSYLKHFSKITKNKPVVMGRKTLEKRGKPFPGRINIVLTSSPHKIKEFKDIRVYSSIDEILVDFDDLVVIGGANTFREFIKRDLVDRYFIGAIEDESEGDFFFLSPYQTSGWKLIEKNSQNQGFVSYTYQRN